MYQINALLVSLVHTEELDVPNKVTADPPDQGLPESYNEDLPARLKENSESWIACMDLLLNLVQLAGRAQGHWPLI